LLEEFSSRAAASGLRSRAALVLAPDVKTICHFILGPLGAAAATVGTVVAAICFIEFGVPTDWAGQNI